MGASSDPGLSPANSVLSGLLKESYLKSAISDVKVKEIKEKLL